MYEDISATKGTGTPIDNLISLEVGKISRIRAGHEGVPEDYLAFLWEIGFGELGDAAYMLYDGPIKPEEIYGRLTPGLAKILLFGDDFQGFNAGFRVTDWAVVEIDSADTEVIEVAADFQTFIRYKIGELS